MIGEEKAKINSLFFFALTLFFFLNRFLPFDPLDGFASRLKFHHTLLSPLQFRILNGVAAVLKIHSCPQMLQN